MKILVATEDELRLVHKYLPEYKAIKIGVGASNVIKNCSKLDLNETYINIGFCGSNSLKIGQVIKVSKSYRLMDNVVEFEDFRNGDEISSNSKYFSSELVKIDSNNAYPCYTSNSFVLKTDITEPCAFDMELNYIFAFPIKLLASIKIVSDNLCLEKYEESIKRNEDEIWDEVKVLINEECQKNRLEVVLDNIFSRKSVRKFTDRPVAKSKIDLLLKAAMAAPSAKNTQPWRFIVVDSQKKLKELAPKLPYARLETAPLAIVVCALLEGYCKFWEQDCAAATQNILLAAEAMGLGACWTAASDEERAAIVREELNIPDSIHPFCVIPIGYPDGEFHAKDKWNPEYVSYYLTENL